MVELLGWIALILVVFAGTTFLIKKYVKNAQTWVIVSMVRFTKPLKIFDILVKHPKWVDRLTDLGLVIGFGAVAVDYLWMQKRPLFQRLIVFVISVGALALLSEQLFPLDNPIISFPPIVLQVAFGIFGIAGFAIVSLFFSGIDIWNKLSIGKNACAGVAPVIPGVDLPNSPISVPLHAWLSFVIILIVHEASHGFVVRKLGMKLKSYGLLLLGFLPIGAFVEPDENELKKLERTKPREALRIYAAGPASNFYFFAIGIVLFSLIGGLLVGPALIPLISGVHLQTVKGVEISEVQENIDICGTEFEAPAHGTLLPGDQVLAVDGNSVATLTDYSLAVRGKENYTLTILRNGETHDYSFEPNELGRIGVTVKEIPNTDYIPPYWYEPLRGVLGFMTGFLGWLLLLNFLVATANFIPVDPFDGGKMAKILVAPYLGFVGLSEEDTKKLVGRIFGFLFLLLVIINAAPLLIVNP